jgi:microcystin-dependent protein
MDPFLGEIRLFGGNFAPRGWMLCNGDMLAISEHDALYSLLGTAFGGDGVVTFALPNLQSRIPVHQFQGPGLSNRSMGEMSGAESVTLSQNQMPFHTHTALGSSGVGHLAQPANAVPAVQRDFSAFSTAGAGNMASALSSAGGSQPHDNLPPFLVVSFIIAIEGIYPVRP